MVLNVCGDNNSSGKKNADSPPKFITKPVQIDSIAQRIAKEVFLKDRNITQLAFTDVPAGTTLIVPGTSVYYPVLNLGAGAKLIIPSNYPKGEILIAEGNFGQGSEVIADGTPRIDGLTAKGDWER